MCNKKEYKFGLKTWRKCWCFFLTHGTSVPVRTLITGRTLISNFASKAMTSLYVTPAVHTLIWARLRTIFAIVTRRWATLNINTWKMSDCTYTLGIICYYIIFIKCSNVSKHTMFFFLIFCKNITPLFQTRSSKSIDIFL